MKGGITGKKWGVYSLNKTVKIADDLESAIREKDIKILEKIFRDFKALRSLIISRGPQGIKLRLIDDGFKLLIKKDRIQISQVKIIPWLLKNKIPEIDLVILAEVYFHLRDKNNFDILFNLIEDNKDKFNDPSVYYWILHTQASWESSVEDNSDKAIDLNKKVVADINIHNDQVLYWKAKFGLTYNKKLLPKQKAKDYLEFAREMKRLDSDFHAFKMEIEAARALLDLSKQQKENDESFLNLEKAKVIALEALKVSKEIGYVNLEIISCEILSRIYFERIRKISSLEEELSKKKTNKKELNKKVIALKKRYKTDQRKLESFLQQSEELRKEFVYESKVGNKYKSTYNS